MDHYKSGQEIYFYHKLQVSKGIRTDYLKTKLYKSSLNSLKVDLNNSLESLISFAPSKFVSHFINVIIVIDNETIELSDDKFHELNHIIRSKLSNINNNKLSFVDDEPFEKYMMEIERRKSYIKKQTKIINEKYLHVLRCHMEYLTL